MAEAGRHPTVLDLAECAELAAQLRVDSIRSSTSAGSGHPTSSMSAADLLAVLVARHLRYDWDDPGNAANDHLIFSKGHASPLLYSVYKAVGVVPDEELMTGYRRFGSRLEGHPTPVLPWVDVATGSLGQGLPIGVGVALADKNLDHFGYRVWVLCGDSELAEGSIWEALDKASHYELSNLTVIVDVNRLGQRGPTELGWDLDAYVRRTEAFGCRALPIDGHDISAIDQAFTDAAHSGRPAVILARTIKGRGFSEVEDKEDWHGKALPKDMADRAIAELGGLRDLRVRGPLPAPLHAAPRASGAPDVVLPSYTVGEKVATRAAYGQALTAIGARTDIVAMDGEVSNSTFAELFAHAYPERFFEMFIAEQQLVASAVGFSVRKYVPFASTFAAFFSRAYDFIRMAAISEANIRLVGSHAGVEIGADGPSQMALEDLAIMRAVHGSTVLYPSDATSTAALVQAMADRTGVVYMRTTRGAYPVLYPSGEQFPVGGSKVLRSSRDDQVTLVGAGVTLHSCLDAAKALADEGISARVIDLYSIKPVDVSTLAQAVSSTRGRLVVAEDHYAQGGIAAAILEALASAGHLDVSLAHLAVRDLPGSGSGEELLNAAGISAGHIVNAARQLLKDQGGTEPGDGLYPRLPAASPAPAKTEPGSAVAPSIRGPPSLLHLAGDRPGVRHRTHVPELVGVAHRADRLDPPVEYVKRQGVEDLAVPVAEDRARLAVHLVGLHSHVDRDEPGEGRGKHPGHIAGADDAPGQLRGLAAAVADDLNVSGEQLPQALDVAFGERVEEPRRQLIPLPAVRLEPRAPRVHVAPRPHRELAARRLRPPHRRRDLGEAEPEHLPQHEHRPLERAEPLEQQQGRHRHRVGQLRRALRVLVGVGEQRLGEPRPGVLLPPDAGRAQHVDRDPGHHGGEEGLDRRGLYRGGLVAQPGLLDRVLCFGHAAEDPVGDREQQRPQLLELLAPGHASSFLKPWRHDG
jgi:transketolase